MPIDPSIPLRARTFQPQSQGNMLAQLMQLKQLQNQGAASEYQLGKMQRDEATQNALRQSLQGAVGPDGQLDEGRVRNAFVNAGDLAGLTSFDSNRASLAKTGIDTQTSKLALAGKQLDLTARAFGSVTDQASYDQALAMLAQQGVPVDRAPPQFDPQYVQQQAESALAYKDKLAAHMQQQTFGETQRHNRASEATASYKAHNSGPMAMITGPDGTVTTIGGQNGIGLDQLDRVANAKGRIKQGEEEGKATGKYYGGRYAEILAAGDQAYLEDSKLSRLDTLLENVDTGKFKGKSTEVKKAAKALGIDLEAMGVTDDVAPVEAARALSNEMALQLRNPAGGAGMPGAMSDADRVFLQSMVPGIETTPQGRKLVIQTRKQLNQRSRDVARMATDYRKQNGALDEGFTEKLQQYSDSNPVFHAVKDDADFEALPKGSYFMAPDGQVRQKP